MKTRPWVWIAFAALMTGLLFPVSWVVDKAMSPPTHWWSFAAALSAISWWVLGGMAGMAWLSERRKP